jgi:cytochrome c biogenesis protein CcdA
VIEISYLAALAGGVLALLSPCSALLLPAFFAYAFQRPTELVGRTLVFYAGLVTVLLPLGAGSALVSRLVLGHRSTIIVVAGSVLIALGVLQLAGRGFGLARIARLQERLAADSATATFALGAVYAFGGFCSGPVLGAVLTVAATSGNPLHGAALLATYGLGMTVPLLALALLWDRLGLHQRRLLRGREVRIAGRPVHTTALLSGLMFVTLGVGFIVWEGTATLSRFYEARGADDLAFSVQRWLAGMARGPADAVLAGLVVALVVGFMVRRRRRARAAEEPASTSTRGG